jgi:hypothetical protein
VAFVSAVGVVVPQERLALQAAVVERILDPLGIGLAGWDLDDQDADDVTVVVPLAFVTDCDGDGIVASHRHVVVGSPTGKALGLSPMVGWRVRSNSSVSYKRSVTTGHHEISEDH